MTEWLSDVQAVGKGKGRFRKWSQAVQWEASAKPSKSDRAYLASSFDRL